MSVKPILFNTDMVRAILTGTKTVTRRVVKPQPELRPVPGEAGCYTYRGIPCGLNGLLNFAPYRPGDILWVRETWAHVNESIGMGLKTKKIIYRANYSDIEAEGWKWRPSIHMPREAARIFLRVTDVRVERLQEIDEAGALAEGAKPLSVGTYHRTAREDFAIAWDDTIKLAAREYYGWAANPWTWVIEFERCEKPTVSDKK